MSSLPTRAIRSTASCALAMALLFASTTAVDAQADRSGSTPPPDPSRLDLYGGYGYIHPVNSDITH